jgi:Zn-dependent protease with chaperone function
MSFEPFVLERIEHHRRSIFTVKLIVAVISLLVMISTATMTAIVLYLGRTSSNPEVRKDFSNAEMLELVIISIALYIPIGAAIYVGYKRAKKRFYAHFVPLRLDLAQQESARIFKEGLRGAGLAAGIQTPEFRVVNIKGISPLTLELEGERPTVVLSSDALYADFSQLEAEALMAHEVAHILIGDDIRPPYKSVFDNFILLMFVLSLEFGFLCMYFGIHSDTRIGNVSAIAGVAILSITIIPVHYVMSLRLRRHDDLLADSIAAKITNNPAALKNALTRLDQLNLMGMIATGRRHKEDRFEARFKPSIDPNELEIFTKEPKELLPARIRNLEAIEQGHWPLFE